MSDYDNKNKHEFWIPPKDNSVFEFTPQDIPPKPEPTPAVEQFANFATGVVMWGALSLFIILGIAVGVRLIKWAAGF